MARNSIADLVGGPVVAVNAGVGTFADTLREQGAQVQGLDWRPPGTGDPEVAWALARLAGDVDDDDAPGRQVDRANEEAVGRVLAAKPRLVDLAPAREVWPDMGWRLQHAGPPVAWERMCGPMRGAAVGAVLLEGWAGDPDGARRLLERGDVELLPNHHHGAVGPMAGVISPSMPVWVVRDEVSGTVAYSNLNEGLGQVLRFGAYGPAVLERLRWMGDVLAPALRAALRALGEPIDLRDLVAQAIQMGDDAHNRNNAGTSLLYRRLSLALLDAGLPPERVRAVLAFVDGNNHFLLNLSMASAKAALDAGHGVAGSTLVTAMSRNGTEFGIRMSGTGERWFTAPAQVPDGLYFAGFGEDDANPDMGDSSITETFGLGGFAMAAAPSMVQFVGGSAADALSYSREMYGITLARNPALTLAPLGFVGVPTGIDARAVVDRGVTPVINTGIAHREAGRGQVGAGIARAPMACFEQALLALAEQFRTLQPTTGRA